MLIQLLLLATIALTIVALRFELVPFNSIFKVFRFAGLAALVVALLSLLVLIWGLRARQLRWPALWGLVLGLLPLVMVMLTVGASNFSVPPIHDISTDTNTPPQFEAIQSLRKPGDNSTTYGGEAVASMQHQAAIYSDIKPLWLPLSVVAATELAAATATGMGWKIVTKEPQRGHLEAVDRTFLLGFHDDVVVRVRARDGGSQVDIRSASRLGLSDLGANGRRIRAFLQVLHKREHTSQSMPSD